MALEVRRIVTGHDANGKAIVTTDERLSCGPAAQSAAYLGLRDLVDRQDAGRQFGREPMPHSAPVLSNATIMSGTGQGTVIRVTEFAPGAPKFMHRTETVDYAILLSGECDLEFDSGEIVHMKHGDIVVQRGTMHAWVNNGSAPAVFAFILIDAQPAEVDGQALRTHYPAP